MRGCEVILKSINRLARSGHSIFSYSSSEEHLVQWFETVSAIVLKSIIRLEKGCCSKFFFFFFFFVFSSSGHLFSGVEPFKPF